MPEYSSTTITPADGVKTPAMNGSTSGNYTLSALRDFILASKGQANGLASLDANGKLPSSQLPDLADDVIVVASYASLPATGTAGKLYITADNNKMYRWDPDLTTPDYVELSVDLSAYATIADLQDGTLEPLISTKAKQDQNGNVIDTTYATKTELAAEESARKSEDSNLKSAIQGNSQRIENLEVAVSGSLVQTNTDATMANTKTITNANEILPWAILKRVGARAVAWNQLLNKVNLRPSSTQSDISCTNNEDGTFTIAGTATADSYTYLYSGSIVLNPSHKYLVFGNSYMMVTVTVNGSTTYFSPSTDLISGASELKQIFNRITNGSTVSYTVGACIFDLTAMGEYDSTLTDAQNIAKFRAKFPASYYPYNTGEIIPLNPSAFKVVGRNKINPNGWEANHAVSTTSGNVFAINGYSCTDFIKVNPSTTYYNKANAGDGGKCYYDANKNFLWGGQAGVVFNWNTQFTLADNVHYIRFYKESSSITDFCLNISDANDGTFTEYKETTIDTSFTSDYLYVNEDCHDYSENVLVNGVMRREEHIMVGSYTFTGNETWIDSGSAKQSDCIASLVKPVTNTTDIGNILAPNLVRTSSYNLYSGSVTSGIAIHSNGNIRVGASDVSSLTGKTIYFELANPSTPTLHDPIPNIPCEDGTTVTAVTPQTDLVNAIDVPSTIAYMTKISS